jgi:hypothetical protein
MVHPGLLGLPPTLIRRRRPSACAGTSSKTSISRHNWITPRGTEESISSL